RWPISTSATTVPATLHLDLVPDPIGSSLELPFQTPPLHLVGDAQCLDLPLREGSFRSLLHLPLHPTHQLSHQTLAQITLLPQPLHSEAPRLPGKGAPWFFMLRGASSFSTQPTSSPSRKFLLRLRAGSPPRGFN